MRRTDDMVQATFTLPLKNGNCNILAQFLGDDGKEYGAYYLYVTGEQSVQEEPLDMFIKSDTSPEA